jgi:hypothetical protein
MNYTPINMNQKTFTSNGTLLFAECVAWLNAEAAPIQSGMSPSFEYLNDFPVESLNDMCHSIVDYPQ